MSLLYEAKDLCKKYGDHTALFLPEFALARGAALAITGPNGSGKSTLLRLLAFLEKPTSGSLRFFGAGSFPRREVSLLLQEPWLARMTVFKNVTLGLRLRGARRDLRQKYEAAMHACGFNDPAAFARRGPGELSGGEKQRVALASRLILKPLALLLDEPTSSVDAASAESVINALAQFRASGGAIACATHDRDLIAALGAGELRLSPKQAEI